MSKMKWIIGHQHRVNDSYRFSHREKLKMPTLSLSEGFSSDTQEITPINFDTPYKNAGILSTLDGNPRFHVQYLTTKTEQWANDTRSHRLTAKQRIRSFMINHYPAIRYILPAITLERHHPYQILKAAIPIIKNAKGFAKSSSTERALLPAEWGGLNIPPIFFENLASRMKYYLFHMRQQGSTGIVLASIIQTHQIEIGTDTNLFKLNYERYGYLATKSCITTL